MKTCSKCKKLLLESNFYAAANCKSGLRSQCKSCCSSYQPSEMSKDNHIRQARVYYYYQHREVILRKAKEFYNKYKNSSSFIAAQERKCIRREKRIQKLDSIACKRGCLICGTQLGMLDWHHRDPKTKVASIKGMCQSYSLEKIEVELKKCDVLCHRCHRRVHLVLNGCNIIKPKKVEKYIRESGCVP